MLTESYRIVQGCGINAIKQGWRIEKERGSRGMKRSRKGKGVRRGEKGWWWRQVVFIHSFIHSSYTASGVYKASRSFRTHDTTTLCVDLCVRVFFSSLLPVRVYPAKGKIVPTKPIFQKIVIYLEKLDIHYYAVSAEYINYVTIALEIKYFFFIVRHPRRRFRSPGSWLVALKIERERENVSKMDIEYKLTLQPEAVWQKEERKGRRSPTPIFPRAR